MLPFSLTAVVHSPPMSQVVIYDHGSPPVTQYIRPIRNDTDVTYIRTVHVDPCPLPSVDSLESLGEYIDVDRTQHHCVPVMGLRKRLREDDDELVEIDIDGTEYIIVS
jgi:hypothetical protein